MQLESRARKRSYDNNGGKESRARKMFKLGSPSQYDYLVAQLNALPVDVRCIKGKNVEVHKLAATCAKHIRADPGRVREWFTKRLRRSPPRSPTA